MASEFAKSNVALDAAIAKCTSMEEIREVTKANLANSGVITRDQESLLYGVIVNPGARQMPQSDSPMPAQPQAAPTCSRVVYPHLNDRYELTGSSEAELDAQESRIRQMFGSQQ